jgi:hypothetical protein
MLAGMALDERPVVALGESADLDGGDGDPFGPLVPEPPVRGGVVEPEVRPALPPVPPIGARTDGATEVAAETPFASWAPPVEPVAVEPVAVEPAVDPAIDRDGDDAVAPAPVEDVGPDPGAEWADTVTALAPSPPLQPPAAPLVAPPPELVPVAPLPAPPLEDGSGVPPAPAPAAPVRPSAWQRWRRRRPRVRKVTRIVRRVDAWSVFKVALVFWTVAYVVVLVAGVLLWNLADTTGTISNVEGFVKELFALDSFELQGDVVFRASLWLGAIVALAGTAATVTAAILFNLITDLVGGIRITVLEEEVVLLTDPPAPALDDDGLEPAADELVTVPSD